MPVDAAACRMVSTSRLAHQANLTARCCAEIAAVEGSFEEGAVVVVVPVEDEDIEAVIGCRVDLLRHHGGIRLVAVAPEGYPRLQVSGEARSRLPDEFPFAPLRRALQARVAGIARVVVAEIVGGQSAGV